MQHTCLDEKEFCENVVFQTVDVSLPISLVPSVNLGNVKIMCCDEPRVECCKACCGGIELRITQSVTYKILIEYGADASAGAATTQCQKCNPTRTITMR